MLIQIRFQYSQLSNWLFWFVHIQVFWLMLGQRESFAVRNRQSLYPDGPQGRQRGQVSYISIRESSSPGLNEFPYKNWFDIFCSQFSLRSTLLRSLPNNYKYHSGADPIKLYFFDNNFFPFFDVKLGHFVINTFFIRKKYSSLTAKIGKCRNFFTGLAIPAYTVLDVSMKATFLD